MKEYNTHEHFIKIYGEKYLSKINHLRRRILEYETGENKFVVLPLEAGIGKSLQTNRIIAEYLSEKTSAQLSQAIMFNHYRRFLIVKFFIEDVLDCEKQINQHCGRNVAVGITSQNWNQFKDNIDSLIFYPVVVITHERYLRLSRDEKMKLAFADGRHTLIIDEMINIPTYTFSETEYRRMENILPISLHQILIDLCYPLFEKINQLRQQKPGNRLVKCRLQLNPKLLRQFKAEVEAQTFQPKDLSEVQKFIETLEVIHHHVSLYNNGRLTSYNPELKHWGLKNNIILDANGQIDKQYKYDQSVVIDRQTPVLTHENWTLHHVPFNSSMSNIKRTENYFEQICKTIVGRKKPTDKTLVVTQLKLKDELMNHLEQQGVQDIAIAHFGDIIGKNEWRDYTQVWIIANPLIPMEIYPLRWSIASQRKITCHSLEMVAEKGKKGRLAFKNKDFEQIRFGCIVSELYQAIKRINRDNTRKAEVFLVNADTDVLKELCKHLKGIRMGEVIQLDVRCQTEKSAKKDQADLLVEYLTGLHQGRYSKSEIREAVGIDKKNFARVLKNDKVKKLEWAKMIEITTRQIIRLADSY